jgi:hypothetical protein
MEFLLVFILAAFLVSKLLDAILVASKDTSVSNQRCNEIRQPHDWEEEPNEYGLYKLRCSKCGYVFGED